MKDKVIVGKCLIKRKIKCTGNLNILRNKLKLS